MSQTLDRTLDAAIAEYLAACDAGTPPERAAFLARYPDLGTSLADFIDQHHRLRGVVRQVHNATVDFQPVHPAEAPTLEPGAGRAVDESLGRIRYFGDYELVQELARGGMGVVFRARQVSLNREVALKMILAGQLASAAEIQRFRTEAEAAANLDHPHILPIYEVGEHQGQQYFSMKLVEGGSLAQRLGEYRRQPRAVATLMIQLARAIHYAHQRGILHRDLKPANVLLDQAGTPFITDFGLAKRTEGGSELTHTGAIVGTPSYMAPEQARAEKQLTTAVDVHALGAILYELLTGQPPYRGATVMDTVMQVLEQEPKPPEQLAPGVDRDLAVIALKCLRKAPTERYASAGDLAADLERWHHGEPILARPISTRERAWKWVRRNPVVASLVGLAAALVVGIVVTLAALLHQTQAHAQESQRRLSEEQQRRQEAQAAAQREKQLKDAADQARQAAEQAMLRERDQRTQTEGLLHANRISLAHQYWKSDDLDRTLALLNEVPPDRRGWEWAYLQRITHGEKVQLPGNGQFTKFLDASADGRWLVAVADTGLASAVVWDLQTNRVAFEVASETGVWVSRAAIAPDGKTLAVGDRRGTVTLWDLVSKSKKRTLDNLKGQITTLAFGPENRLLVVGGVARIVDTATGTEIPLPATIKTPLALFPDGKHLLGMKRNPKFYRTSLHENLLIAYDLATGQEVHSFGFMRAWSFTPDGRWIAVAGFDAQEKPLVEVVEWPTRKVVMSARGLSRPGDMALSHDGKLLATVPHMGVPITVWDVAAGRVLRPLRGHTEFLNAVLFLADGRLASCSWDRTIRLWDPRLDVDATRLPGAYANVVSDAALQPGKSTWAIVQGDHMGSGFGVVGRLVMGPGPAEKVTLADPVAGKVVQELTGHTDGARLVAFSADGQRLLSGGRDGLAVVWDAVQGTKIAEFKHPGWVAALALSPNGRLAASTHDDPKVTQARFGQGPWEDIPGEVRLWDADTGKERHVLKGFPSGVYALAFAPDGKTLATTSNQTLTLWDTATGKARAKFAAPGRFPSRIQFTTDGQHVLMLEDHMIRKWDIVAGRDGGGFAGPRQTRFRGLAFHPDGQRAAIAAGRQVKLIDLRTMEELLTLSQPAAAEDADDDVAAVGFTPDGRTLLALTTRGTTTAWTTTPAGIVAGGK
jgi:WD40 repeat protein